MKVVVTGAAGMVGSNLVHGLNAIGVDDVIAVDDLTDGQKYRNLAGAQISDYFDKAEFYERFTRGEFGAVVYLVLHILFKLFISKRSFLISRVILSIT